MLLASLSFDHIGFVAGFEDQVSLVLFTVEVEALYIVSGVA